MSAGAQTSARLRLLADRNAAAMLRNWFAWLSLMLFAFTASACSSGSYPLDVFPEMHYQPWNRALEPQRLAPPDGAVPITGAAPRLGWADAAALGPPTELGAGAGELGARIYSRDCAMCHGVSGRGDGPMAAYYQRAAAAVVPPVDLSRGRVQERTDGQLWWLIRNGIGNMPPYDRLLNERDTWLTVWHIRSLREQP
ncbi:MAG: c-type cytochrome [Chloroflexota bacterium]